MTLRVDNVRVELRGRTVLHDVRLDVPAGRILAVVGPNGAGKSTLLKAMAGLLAPVAGDIRLDGQPIAGLDAAALGRAIAYLPQERVVHWPLPARSVVALGRMPHRGQASRAGESAADGAATEAAMRAVDVTALAGWPISELSGGERARVLVARALAQQARFLLADEPTAGLDPAHTLALCTHFERLAAQGCGVVVALHDLTLAARFAHRILLLKDGTVLAEGAPREVLTAERLAEAYAITALVTEVAGKTIVVPLATLT